MSFINAHFLLVVITLSSAAITLVSTGILLACWGENTFLSPDYKRLVIRCVFGFIPYICVLAAIEAVLNAVTYIALKSRMDALAREMRNGFLDGFEKAGMNLSK